MDPMLLCPFYLVMRIYIIHAIMLRCLDCIVIMFILLSMLATYTTDLFPIIRWLILHHTVHHELHADE